MKDYKEHFKPSSDLEAEMKRRVIQMIRHACAHGYDSYDDRKTSRVITREIDEYVDDQMEWINALSQFAQQEVEDYINLLDEARLQLEYLNEKFTETGTTNAVLARITSKLKQNEK